jgi:hypothetical protein
MKNASIQVNVEKQIANVGLCLFSEGVIVENVTSTLLRRSN